MMMGVERIHAQSVLTNTTLSLVNATDVEQIWNYRSGAGSSLTVTDIQENATLGFFDTASTTNASFGASADLSEGLKVVLDNAAAILTIPGGPGFDALHITSIDSKGQTTGNSLTYGPGPAFASLTVIGDENLTVLDTVDQDLDSINMIDTTKFDGLFTADLNTNNSSVDFDGGDGGHSVILGDGNSTIDFGAGDDKLTVGGGNNTINTGDGDDSVSVGAGNNTIDLGSGDDFVNFNGHLDASDAAEGGDGIDTIASTLANFVNVTATSTVDAVVNGFEKMIVDGVAMKGEPASTIDLDNLDDINHVTLGNKGSEVTEAGINEVQIIDVDDPTVDGVFSIFGVEIDVAAADTLADVQNKIIAAEAAIKLANPNVQGVAISGGGVEITYFSSAGRSD